MRPENAASRRVLEKAGFREEGLLKRYLNVDGAWRDHYLVAITVEEVDGSVAAGLVRRGSRTGTDRRPGCYKCDIWGCWCLSSRNYTCVIGRRAAGESGRHGPSLVGKGAGLMPSIPQSLL